MRLFDYTKIIFQGQGGNSNNGKTARKFFYTQELRQRVLDWVPAEHREPFRVLMSNTSVLLRLMDSDLPVNIEGVTDLCLDTYIHLVQYYGRETTILGFTHQMISEQFQNFIEQDKKSYKSQ